MRSVAYPSSMDGEVDGGAGAGGVFAATASTSGGDSRNLADSRRQLLSRYLLNGVSSHASRGQQRTAAAAGSLSPPLPSPLVELRTTSKSTASGKGSSAAPLALGGMDHGKGRSFERSSSSLAGPGNSSSQSIEALRGRLTRSKSTVERSLPSSFVAVAAPGSTESIPSTNQDGGVSLAGGNVAFDISTAKRATAVMAAGAAAAAGVSGADNRESEKAAHGSKAGRVVMRPLSAAHTMSMSPLLEDPQTTSGAPGSAIGIGGSSDKSSQPASPSTSAASTGPSVKEVTTAESSTEVGLELPAVLPGPDDDLTEAESSAAINTKAPQDTVGAAVARAADAADARAVVGPNPVVVVVVGARAVDAPADDTSRSKPSEVAGSRLPEEEEDDPAPPRREGREESPGGRRRARPGRPDAVSPKRRESSQRTPSSQIQRAPGRTLSPHGRPSPARRSLSGRGASPGRGPSKAWSTSPAPASRALSPKRSLSPSQTARSASSSASVLRQGPSSPARMMPSPNNEQEAPAGSGNVTAAETSTAETVTGALKPSSPSCSPRPSNPSPPDRVADAPHDEEEDPSARQQQQQQQHQERGGALERLPRSPQEPLLSTGRSQLEGALALPLPPQQRSTASLSPSMRAHASGGTPEMDDDDDDHSGATEGSPGPAGSSSPTSEAAANPNKVTRNLREVAAAADIWGAVPEARSVSCGFSIDSARRHVSYTGVRRSDSVGWTSTMSTQKEDPSDLSSTGGGDTSWSRWRGRGGRGGAPELGLPSSKFVHAAGDGGGEGKGGVASTTAAIMAATSKTKQGGGMAGGGGVDAVAAETKKTRKRGKVFGRAVARIFGRRDGSSSAKMKGEERGLML